MGLEQTLNEKQGEAEITTDVAKFSEFVLSRIAFRTHLLKVGDYIVLPDEADEKSLILHKIGKVNCPIDNDYSKGTYVTVNGARGSLSTNMFVKIDGIDGCFRPHL